MNDVNAIINWQLGKPKAAIDFVNTAEFAISNELVHAALVQALNAEIEEIKLGLKTPKFAMVGDWVRAQPLPVDKPPMFSSNGVTNIAWYGTWML